MYAAATALLLLSGCPMVMDQHLGTTGLWTNPNPHTAAPDGAMLRAEDVVFRRKGTVEPRPGFKYSTLFSSLDSVWGLLPFDGSYLAVGDQGDTYNTRWDTAVSVTDDNVQPLDWAVDAVRAQAARKNLYLTTTDTVRKLTSSLDSVASPAGVVRPLAIAVTTTGTSIADDTKVAYRALIRRKDANGLVTRSAPSGRSILENTTGGDAAGSVAVIFGGAYNVIGIVAAGDTIELYRTRGVSNTLTPPDEMFLAREHEITTSNVTAGSAILTDTTADADLGAALYTNGSREGIARENIRPPVCTDLALYNGSLFCSRITGPNQLLLRVTEAGSISTATGVGARTYTGTRVTLTNTITGLSSVVGLQVGMVLSDRTGWNGTGRVRITGIAGSDLTMSETWPGATDGAPVSLTFYDTIRINDGTIDDYWPIQSVAHFLTNFALVNATIGGSPSNTMIAYAVGDAVTATNTAQTFGNRRTFQLENVHPGGPAFTVYATHGDEYEPPLPLPTASPGEASVRDVLPNAVTWSKGDQPEHFMTSVRWLVGREDVPILRIFGTRTALWILKGKGDGVYRLTGFGERSGWRVDQFDSSTYLLHPSLACQYGDAVYMWSNVGAVMVSDSGVVNLSDDPIGDKFTELQMVLDHSGAPYAAAFAVANEKDGEIIFGLPPTDFGSESPALSVQSVYVLNTVTKAWSQWFAVDDDEDGLFSTAAYDPETRKLLLGEGESGQVHVERGPGGGVNEPIRHADREFTVTINSVVGSTITIAALSGWTPAEGDLLVRGSAYAVVTGVTSATVFDVHDATGVTAGSGTGYTAFTSTLAWLTKTGKAPSAVKRFRELVTHWEDTYGIYTWTLEYDPLKYGAAASAEYTRTYAREEDAADDLRAFVPRDAGLGSRLGITLAITQADSRWRLAGITAEMEPAGGRLNR